jgi:hypothetical protein
MRTCVVVCVLGGLLWVMGCASLGQEYNYENIKQLELGKTRQSDYRAMFGEPRTVNVKERTDGVYETVHYMYAHGTLAGAAARVLNLEFKDGLLNAYASNSGFEEDATTFDIRVADQIQVGVSTKEDVRRLLPPPSGRARCPTTLVDFTVKNVSAKEVWLWLYTNKSEGLDTESIKSRSLKLLFDGTGRVIDKETAQDL